MKVMLSAQEEAAYFDRPGLVPCVQSLKQKAEPDTRLRRVLMTTDTIGGVWTYSLELARGLEQQGIEVALATMGASLSDAQRRQISHCAVSQIYESQFRLEWMEEPWKDLGAAGEWLLQLEQEFRPDVVHLNHYVHGMLPWKAPVLIVGHSCVLSWWLAVKACDAPSSWNRYRRHVRRGIQSADAVVAPSRWMQSALQAHYGPLRQVLTIYNGRCFETFPSRKKEPFVFSAGRLWDEGKNRVFSQASG